MVVIGGQTKTGINAFFFKTQIYSVIISDWWDYEWFSLFFFFTYTFQILLPGIYAFYNNFLDVSREVLKQILIYLGQ